MKTRAYWQAMRDAAEHRRKFAHWMRFSPDFREVSFRSHLKWARDSLALAKRLRETES